MKVGIICLTQSLAQFPLSQRWGAVPVPMDPDTLMYTDPLAQLVSKTISLRVNVVQKI